MEPEPQIDLWTAAGEGQLSEVRRLVEAGMNVEQSFSQGITALHYATLHGHRDIVRYLVENGADVNKATDYGLTPLMSACAQGFSDIATYLVQRGASVNAVTEELESPLLYLCKARQTRARISTGAGSVHGFYKVCRAETTCGCMDLVKLLVGAGADVNHTDCGGASSLMGFIMSRHFEVSKFLVSAGADPNYVHPEGNTALLLACRLKNSLELVETLIAAGANVNQATDPEGTTPLMSACYRGLDLVEALIHAGASVNATDWKGETALKCAVFATNPTVIEYLIKAGVKITKELILAVIIGHGESIQTLITNGALPIEHGNMESFQHDIEYLSRRYNVTSSNFLTHRLLKHLDELRIKSLTPFMVALMRRNDSVAQYFVRNRFFNPLDICLLQDYMKNMSKFEEDGVSAHFCCLICQPWSLHSLSLLTASFAIGFDVDRQQRISASGLPLSLQRKLSFQDSSAHMPVHDWANIVLSL